MKEGEEEGECVCARERLCVYEYGYERSTCIIVSQLLSAATRTYVCKDGREGETEREGVCVCVRERECPYGSPSHFLFPVPGGPILRVRRGWILWSDSAGVACRHLNQIYIGETFRKFHH